MILPTKGISTQRALITVGAQTLEVLTLPRTANSAFEATQQLRMKRGLREPLSFDWFSLGLVLLYSIGVIGLDNDGLLVRMTRADH
jgi:hypothetical protein